MIDIIIKVIQMKLVTNLVIALVLFFVLKKIFDWFNERNNLKVVNEANKKIISLLKPYIIKGQFPPKETYTALLTTVARDYEIEKNDMHTVKMFCQEFIREILENEYIPEDKKVDYCEILRKQIIADEEGAYLVEEQADMFERKKKSSRENNQLNLCTVFSGLAVLAINVLSEANDIYESLSVFAITLCILFLVSDIGIKREHYKDIPRLIVHLKRKAEVRKKAREIKKEEAAKPPQPDTSSSPSAHYCDSPE